MKKNANKKKKNALVYKKKDFIILNILNLAIEKLLAKLTAKWKGLFKIV